MTSTKLTFLKKHFTPQWRFFIHTILHCLSQKKTSWEQFSGNMAAALICLATNKKFNFSKYIFEGMVKNVDSETKFLMYPRFIKCLINKSKHVFLPPTKPFKTPKLTHKVFSNMKIGFHGEKYHFLRKCYHNILKNHQHHLIIHHQTHHQYHQSHHHHQYHYHLNNQHKHHLQPHHHIITQHHTLLHIKV